MPEHADVISFPDPDHPERHELAERHEAEMAELVARQMAEVMEFDGMQGDPSLALPVACRSFRFAVPRAFKALGLDPAPLAEFSVRNPAAF